jgi:two-component system, OmpR family, alkaline phosphatase synthesis response regulator PhoP
MVAKKATVLAVDDDASILRLIQLIMEANGFRVLKASDGESALNVLNEETPDIILLDIKMPGMDGYTICQHIRKLSQIPIIMVTAKGSVEEITQGLELGADDYIVKPFSNKELVARIGTVLRRANLWDKQPGLPLQFGELVIDFASHKVSLAGRTIELTVKEYKVLSYLSHNAGRVITYDQILEAIWGEDYLGDCRLVRATILRLRQKLGDISRKPKFIATRTGIGYEFIMPE